MSSSKLDCAQKFLNVAEQRYQEACDAKEIGDAKAVRRKIKEAKRVYRSAQQQRDFAAVVQAGISLSYLGATKIRYRGASIYDLFFGGVGLPDGVGHGHVVIKEGRIVYKRDPSLAHLPEGEEL
ncbi:MAG: hypothetical protein ACFNYO_01855 [Candidatus Saccharimonas sp.]